MFSASDQVLLTYLLLKEAGDTSSLPPISIQTQPASPKHTLPGMVAPQNYTQVNTTDPATPDAGALAQKAQPALGATMLPKQAQATSSEDLPMSITARPLVQDLVKQAMSKSAHRAQIAVEGARQMKLADGDNEEDVKETASSVSTEYANKLASAVEWMLPKIASTAPGPSMSEHIQGLPEGVSHSHQSGSNPAPSGQGSAHHQPPKHPGQQKGLPGEHGTSMMENTLNHAPGGSGEQQLSISGGKGKAASVVRNLARLKKLGSTNKKAMLDLALTGGLGYHKAESHTKGQGADGALRGMGGYMAGAIPAAIVGAVLGGAIAGGAGAHAGALAGTIGGGVAGYKHMTSKYDEKSKKHASIDALSDALLDTTKQAEDAINKSNISAGAAQAPPTSEAGQSGGAPVGGMPQGPSGLVGSNDSAMHYTKGQAYANRKGDLKAYLTEPALTSATDKTLQEAFAHTGQAGVKISSAQSVVQVGAARALLAKLAAATETNKGMH